MKIFFAVCLGAIMASRLRWFDYYIRRARENGDSWDRIGNRQISTLTANEQTETALNERQKNALDLARRQIDTSILGGTIALAAWTVVLVGNPGSHGLSGPSLDFLFLSGLVLILGPMIGRSLGGYLTYIVLESSIYVGFGSLVLALSSIANDLGRTWGRALAIAAAVMLVIRELMDVASQLEIVDIVFPGGPAAFLTVAPDNGMTEMTITADASASTEREAPIKTFEFDFGDGHRVHSGRAAVVPHTYERAGKYPVTVTVKDAKRRKSQATRTVTVHRRALVSYLGRITEQRRWVARTTHVELPVVNASQTGSTLIVSVMLSNTTDPVDVDDSKGNKYTPVGQANSSTHRVLLFVVVNATHALDTSDHIKVRYGTAATCCVAVDEFSKLNTKGAFASSTGPVDGATFASSGVTTSGNSQLLFTAVGTSGGTSAAFDGDWIALDPLPTSTNAPEHIACAYQIVTAPGKYASTGTTTGQWAAVLSSFR